MEISAALVKDLREKTGAGMMDCKRALAETSGDFEKAIDYLRKKGIANAAKKSGRATKEGAVYSYIHGEGKVGVMVEVNCETDFVARTEQFKQFVKDVSMHIAAASPTWVRSDEVPAEVLAKEKEIAIAQMQNSGKPAAMLEKIAEGKLKKFYEENCLLNQAFVKDPSKTIEQLLKETIATLGENMSIRRFARFALGQGLESKEA
ncbi:MAG TPA: elongation factor Ts [Bdellovibrionales bacterium]|nr:MAG: elongation factor Ts [Bdellovibrionales bacterium GWB1_52_6]OFZ03365.1 MAG: elongation factor Ts [Bdellovibrionales bacterium GWA1_52_35]OFZ34647.1 MAG: elongation factor Ts [Bdellovibrionales bacterium GWC1_52_8]HAR42561.1 elongation factor Ts [Bdellovibrionales bacterium]HCM40948.1 elongation factor Ts [Bdellovibrionales bacterium]